MTREEIEKEIKFLREERQKLEERQKFLMAIRILAFLLGGVIYHLIKRAYL